MKQKNEHIFLLVQSGYSARNFILSDFFNQDKAKVTFWSDQNYIKQYDICNEFIKIPDYQYDRKINFIQKIKNKAELYYNAKKFKNKDYLLYLINITKITSFRIQFKNLLSSLIAHFFSTTKGIQYLDKPFYKAVRKTPYYFKCRNQLLDQKPTMVFCTHQRASSAVAPMLAAKDLGIKTICFIHSWDNIPKGVQLVKADEYFVWSAYMKQEMLDHYPFIKAEMIKITGTPQFIPYFKNEYKIERDEFLTQYYLDSGKKYILFSGNDKTTSPNDPIYLEDLTKTVKKLNEEKNIYRILFRPNPIDRNEGFTPVLEKYADLITELKPEWFGSETFLWNRGGPSKRDMILLINTILHSELVVNMGSTMALDAALLGKACCYIKYDVPSKYNWSVNRIYKFIHFKIIKDLKPVFWIKNRNDGYNVISKALKNPFLTEEERKKWIQRVTKLPIEETNKRMWNYLTATDEI